MIWKVGKGMLSAYRLAIAHAIERDGSVAQFHEVKDLVAPAKRHVRKPMN